MSFKFVKITLRDLFNTIVLTALLIDYDPATVIDGEYIVVFKQDAEDRESKSLRSAIIIDILC